MQVAKHTEELEMILDYVYSYPGSFIQKLETENHIYCGGPGAARVHSILGYITAMRHAGNLEFANKLAVDFVSALNRVSVNPEYYDIKNKYGRDVKIPNTKVMLSDDNTFNSFSFAVLKFLKPAGMKELLEIRTFEQIKYDYRIVTEIPSYSLGTIDPTEIDYTNDSETNLYYSFRYNGGIIYHGPGKGETFTVNLDDTTLWGIHT